MVKEVPENIKQLCRDYRTARMNTLYYAAMLKSRGLLNRWIEIVLAITASSTVATWAFWKTGVGEVIWISLGGLSAVLCIVKPILNLSKDIERYNTLWAGYIELFHDLRLWVDRAKQSMPTDVDLEKALTAGANKLKMLEVQDDPSPDKKLLKKCQEQVRREIPEEELWPAWISGE